MTIIITDDKYVIADRRSTIKVGQLIGMDSRAETVPDYNTMTPNAKILNIKNNAKVKAVSLTGSLNTIAASMIKTLHYSDGTLKDLNDNISKIKIDYATQGAFTLLAIHTDNQIEELNIARNSTRLSVYPSCGKVRVWGDGASYVRHVVENNELLSDKLNSLEVLVLAQAYSRKYGDSHTVYNLATGNLEANQQLTLPQRTKLYKSALRKLSKLPPLNGLAPQ